MYKNIIGGIIMKKRLQGFIAGTLSGVLLSGTVVALANTTTLYDVFVGGIKIVVDGQKINPKDANGKTVEPMIYNGTTYLPVRAVADALGKAVYWDGPNYTVYLGQIPNGSLQYPTVSITDMDNIGKDFYSVRTDKLTDNYGNSYSSAIYSSVSGTRTYQTLLNMKYSRFKATLYVPKGCSSDRTAKIIIKTDGKTVYSSPEITKTTAPVHVDVDIRGCNDFQIEVTGGEYLGYIADAGFYQ